VARTAELLRSPRRRSRVTEKTDEKRTSNRRAETYASSVGALLINQNCIKVRKKMSRLPSGLGFPRRKIPAIPMKPVGFSARGYFSIHPRVASADVTAVTLEKRRDRRTADGRTDTGHCFTLSAMNTASVSTHLGTNVPFYRFLQRFYTLVVILSGVARIWRWAGTGGLGNGSPPAGYKGRAPGGWFGGHSLPKAHSSY